MTRQYTTPHWSLDHDDVIKWKRFPRYWPFVRRIHRSPLNSPHKVQWRGALMFALIWALNKRLSKQPQGWWFGTPSCSLWRIGMQSGRFYADDTFKRILVSENLSPKFVPKRPIKNKPELIEIMAWHRTGNRPLYEQIITQFTNGCVTKLQWINIAKYNKIECNLIWFVFDFTAKCRGLQCNCVMIVWTWIRI